MQLLLFLPYACVCHNIQFMPFQLSQHVSILQLTKMSWFYKMGDILSLSFAHNFGKTVQLPLGLLEIGTINRYDNV